MLYNSFSKRVHAHDLLLLWQVLARAGGTLFPGEGPKLQTSWLLQSCTENRGSGSHSSSYWFWCFHFLVQKLGTPWVACRHLIPSLSCGHCWVKMARCPVAHLRLKWLRNLGSFPLRCLRGGLCISARVRWACVLSSQTPWQMSGVIISDRQGFVMESPGALN